MTTNPFDRRRSAAPASYYVAKTPQEEADLRNARLTRPDIEWFVTHDGAVMLRDKPEWTRRHTAEIAQKAERERRDWKRNNGFG